MSSILIALFQKLLTFVQSIYDDIFGSWNYQAIFSWLPSDIQAAVTSLIVILFVLALVHFVRSLIPG